MQEEITAAEASLVETQDRLEINETDLCRTLELAEDIAAVYELQPSLLHPHLDQSPLGRDGRTHRSRGRGVRLLEFAFAGDRVG